MFANDTFRNGGDLVDQTKWYAGRDKMQHLVIAVLLVAGMRRWTGIGNLFLAAGIFVLGILWELAEWWRFRRWQAQGSPEPRPAVCDRPSWRDLIANQVGATLGIFVF